MRRTEIHERGGIGRAARSGGPGSTESVMMRWRLFEASAPQQLDVTRLLPGGEVRETVIDMPWPSRTRDAQHPGARCPEPGVGFGEEGDPAGPSRAIHLLHLHASCSAGVPGEELGDMTTGDPCLRHHAT